MPTSLMAAAALTTFREALRTAPAAPARGGRALPEEAALLDPAGSRSEKALAALLLLREVRHQLAEWEPALIEEARQAGASWADLAQPLGVSSRQAAERRYLRVRPGTPGTTGEERVQATRDRRAADRSVTAWARANAAHLRQLAGQVTALTDLPAGSRPLLGDLTTALAADDAAALVAPLAATQTYLASGHPDLAARVEDVTRRTGRLRKDSGDRRGRK